MSCKKSKKRTIALLASFFLILGLGIVGTIAWMTDKTVDVANTFTAGELPNKVVENFENNVKNDVAIKNTGDVDAYIRAAVNVTWIEIDKNGNATGSVYGMAPVAGVDYEWYPSNAAEPDKQGMVGAGWVKGADGYYYYTKQIAPGFVTDMLFTKCQPKADPETGKTPNQPEGYVLSVEIMGQTIQADGADKDGNQPVMLTWGIPKGSVESVSTDGTLVIRK